MLARADAGPKRDNATTSRRAVRAVRAVRTISST
jgi:hypothetical protein